MQLKGWDKPYTGYLCFTFLLFSVCIVQAHENQMLSFRMKGNIVGMEVNTEQLLEKVLHKLKCFFNFHPYLKLVVWSKIHIFFCRYYAYNPKVMGWIILFMGREII